MPSARRVPDSEVLASSMTGNESDLATRESRTTLMSGSGAGAGRGGAVRRRHHRAPRSLPAAGCRASATIRTRDAGDEQHADDEQDDAQLGHSAPCQPVAMRTASSTSTDTRREQPGSVIVTPINCEASSMVALLCVMKMNCTRSDICFDDVAEPADVVFVERRVHFVEDAERRGIQVEDREHQRHGGERLLAARELVDAAVALAGRPRHDGDAGLENVFADQLEIGMATAEQLGEFVLAGRC